MDRWIAPSKRVLARSRVYVQLRKALPVAEAAPGFTFAPRGIAPSGMRMDASAVPRNSPA